jgi:hypothetical protein
MTIAVQPVSISGAVQIGQTPSAGGTSLSLAGVSVPAGQMLLVVSQRNSGSAPPTVSLGGTPLSLVESMELEAGTVTVEVFSLTTDTAISDAELDITYSVATVGGAFMFLVG